MAETTQPDVHFAEASESSSADGPRILVIDNYDSFVYTLVGYLQQLGARTTVVRNDVFAPDELESSIADIDGVLLSPGPGVPADSGICPDLIRLCAARSLTLMGVCLGHQAIAEAYGATVTHSPELMHGKTSLVVHEDAGLFAGQPNPFTATRYHSLAVVDQTIDEDEFIVTARTEGGVVMGIQHRRAPLHGVQFHPESVLTEGGYRMLANWLETAGSTTAVQTSEGMTPLVRGSVTVS
ncbi:gamma-glutamyl-gamma-aminobutyrate hydrolase family protein [Saxibacter everestensis]|uniref:Gamma-glutamyl-gamma-aminobutyrate hydrolase family protein n=1 Tax=Saxibacter everestensis TaxID=2909229 RepID=A0ABY8QTR3_9MICO|nr:gamma-glutamyl-gamma-aminobutyrate hydrolase family protein [Brevibacteriaceae bacterium ZFBP1038]